MLAVKLIDPLLNVLMNDDGKSCQSNLANLLIIFQEEEDKDDKDERWDPDSDMEVDDERYFNFIFLFYSHYLAHSSLQYTD